MTPEYPAAMGLVLRSGRWFEASDSYGTLPVAIVSESLARKLWPGQSAVDRQIRVGGTDAAGEPWLQVVGVAADVRQAPQEPPRATLYRPVRQHTPPWLYLMARTATESDFLSSVKQTIWDVAPDQAIDGPYRLAEWVSDLTAPMRFIVIVGATFSLIGVLLAFTGVYGLVADLSQRALREIGIRKALGATTEAILRLFMYRTMHFCIPAIAIGTVGGVGLLQWLATEIGPVGNASRWSIPVAATLFIAMVAAATLLSSRRAAHADPVATMRSE